jgi:hypothetical protein
VKYKEGLLRRCISETGDEINGLVSGAEMQSLPDPKLEDSEGDNQDIKSSMCKANSVQQIG